MSGGNLMMNGLDLKVWRMSFSPPFKKMRYNNFVFTDAILNECKLAIHAYLDEARNHVPDIDYNVVTERQRHQMVTYLTGVFEELLKMFNCIESGYVSWLGRQRSIVEELTNMSMDEFSEMDNFVTSLGSETRDMIEGYMSDISVLAEMDLEIKEETGREAYNECMFNWLNIGSFGLNEYIEEILRFHAEYKAKYEGIKKVDQAEYDRCILAIKKSLQIKENQVNLMFNHVEKLCRNFEKVARKVLSEVTPDIAECKNGLERLRISSRLESIESENQVWINELAGQKREHETVARRLYATQIKWKVHCLDDGDLRGIQVNVFPDAKVTFVTNTFESLVASCKKLLESEIKIVEKIREIEEGSI